MFILSLYAGETRLSKLLIADMKCTALGTETKKYGLSPLLRLRKSFFPASLDGVSKIIK